MKLRNLLLALSACLSCVALAGELTQSPTYFEALSDLSPEEMAEKEQIIIQNMGLPCDPYPKCAG